MSSPTGEDRNSARLPAGVLAFAHSRRLSAILHADLAGYVRLMAGAEDRTVNRLKSVRAEVWQPAVEAAGGWIVNIVADSVLAEFSSAVAAVAVAVDVQQRMARFNDGLDEEQRLMFRIGLHLGEVIVDETETIFGDAVNVAARIQLMAEPGGIAASTAMRDATHQQIDCVFVDGGKRHAKNVGHSLRIYHVRSRKSASRPLTRAASWTRGAGVTARGPALWGTIAAAALLLVGGGYLAFTAEQLKQAMVEWRKADALRSEEHRLAEQTRQSVDMEAKRRTNAELENAQEARQKAEHELAQLKTDIEAQRKTGAEAASLREAEEVAKKAIAETATRHLADQTRAIATGRRKQAEPGALTTASRTAPAMPALDGEAETAESHLRLGPADRQRLQIALTLVGFDTRGDDGVFGPRSREMIANWQKAHNQPATGFVTSAQQQALLKAAAATLSKHDEQNIAEAVVRTVTETPAPPPNPLPASADGLWRGTYECRKGDGNVVPFTLKPEILLKGRTGTWYMAHPSWTNDQTFGINVSIDGTSVVVTRRGGVASASERRTPLLGRFAGNSIQASNSVCTMTLTRDASPRS